MNMQNVSEQYKHELIIEDKSIVSDNSEATFENVIHVQNIKKIF